MLSGQGHVLSDVFCPFDNSSLKWPKELRGCRSPLPQPTASAFETFLPPSFLTKSGSCNTVRRRLKWVVEICVVRSSSWKQQPNTSSGYWLGAQTRDKRLWALSSLYWIFQDNRGSGGSEPSTHYRTVMQPGHMSQGQSWFWNWLGTPCGRLWSKVRSRSGLW